MLGLATSENSEYLGEDYVWSSLLLRETSEKRGPQQPRDKETKFTFIFLQFEIFQIINIMQRPIIKQSD